MKKLIYCALALAAGLFAASCQQENLEPAAQENTVTYTVEVPGIVTKAIADGKNVDRLYYEVYMTNGTTQADLSDATLLYKKDIAMVTSQEATSRANVTLNLVQNQNYTVLFWAQCDIENPIYDVTNLRKVTYKEGATIKSNHEDYAAFYAVDYISDATPRDKKVYLKRPFAQLNIGTTINPIDYNEDPYRVVMKKSKVTVKDVPTTFNVATSTVGGDAEFTFEMEEVISDENLVVNNTEYNYAAMNYMFAGDNRTATVEYWLEAEVMTQNNVKVPTNLNKAVVNVPLKENYRTNIVGNLLTSSTEYEVIVDADWAGADLAPDPLYLAAANGGDVTLTKDIVLTAPLEVKAEMTINLNGKTISGEIEKGNGAVVNIADGASVILNGGTLKNTAANGDAAINNDGTLVLNGVTIQGAPLADGGYSAYAVISSGNMVIEEGTTISADRGSIKVTGAGETVINGGTFTNNDIGSRALTSHVVDVEDGSTHKLTINGGTFQHLHTATSGGVVICNRSKGTVYVNGGNFSGGNYYGNNNLSDYGYGGTFSVKGGAYDANPASKYIADGYKAVEKNGKFYVVSNETNNVVATPDELRNALNEAKATGETEVVIDAAGASINLEYGFSSSNVPAGTTVTIRNANVEGKSKNNYADGTLIFEDCTFNNPGGAYSIHFDGGKGSLIFKNCDLYGWNSFGGELESVSFENCTLSGNGIYALIRSYTDLTLKNCTINISNANLTDEWPDGIEVVSPATLTEENVVYVVDDIETLQNVLDKANRSTTIQFTNDFEGNVTVVQKAGVKITIDGLDHKYNGFIKVHSNSNYYADAALTIKDVNFETSAASINFIEALENGGERYSQNITVEDCTFTASGEGVNTSVAVQVKACRNVIVKNCTAKHLHSLLQAQSCDTGDVKVVNCNVNGKNGVAFKAIKAAKVEGTTITAREYGIRYDGNIDNYGIVIKNNNVTAYQPLIVRKMTGANNTITLEGENTLTTDEIYQIVITNGSDDEAYVTPIGTYTLTGADNYAVYPITTYCESPITNKEPVTYTGEFFDNPINDALYFKNYYFKGDAAINVTRTYGAIILENCKADINGDLITIDNDNNSVMVLQNLDLTLAEGKKLIKSKNTIYQVFMENITINGVLQTQESIADYLENVAWYQVVEEI